jgi:hypothetical protein
MRISEDLDVNTVALVLAGVVAAVLIADDPVDRDQRAVEDHERLRATDPHRLVEARRGRGQQVDRLPHVPVHGRDSDSEAAASRA